MVQKSLSRNSDNYTTPSFEALTGKSTTIRSMLGLIKYDQGEIRINGLDSVKDREKILADIGYMPSEAWFYSGMTIREMLKHSADVRKVDCTDEAEKLCGGVIAQADS